MSDKTAPLPAPDTWNERESDNPPPGVDPDMARLIELVERIGGHGEQPL